MCIKAVPICGMTASQSHRCCYDLDRLPFLLPHSFAARPFCQVLAAEAKKCSGNAQGDRFVIKVIPDEGLPSIDVDRQLIALVYRNAISNACRVRSMAVSPWLLLTCAV